MTRGQRCSWPDCNIAGSHQHYTRDRRYNQSRKGKRRTKKAESSQYRKGYRAGYKAGRRAGEKGGSNALHVR